MSTASHEALQLLRIARSAMVRGGTSFDVGRIKSKFTALDVNDARKIEQSVILELHETLKLLQHPIYPVSLRKSFAEAMVYFTRLYDWGNDERLIDQTLAWGMEVWGYERVFKLAIQVSMASLAPEEHQRLFGYKAIGRDARNAEEAQTTRIWRWFGVGLVVALLGIAFLAKRLSP